jgi:hypothetical protein
MGRRQAGKGSSQAARRPDLSAAAASDVSSRSGSSPQSRAACSAAGRHGPGPRAARFRLAAATPGRPDAAADHRSRRAGERRGGASVPVLLLPACYRIELPGSAVRLCHCGLWDRYLDGQTRFSSRGETERRRRVHACCHYRAGVEPVSWSLKRRPIS